MKWGMGVVFNVIALTVFAAPYGNDSGNGGDAIVCANGEVELFDFYEGRVLRGLVPSLAGNLIPLEQKLELFLSRIEGVDKPRAERYRQKIKELMDDRHWVNEDLVDIPDIGQTPISSSCKVVQAAIRQKPVFPEDKTYLFHKPTWNLMDDDSRAGLILHEVIYAEAIDINKHANSKMVRYFNSWIASKSGTTLTPDTYQKLIQLTALANSATELNRMVYFSGGASVYTLKYFPVETRLDVAIANCRSLNSGSHLRNPIGFLPNSVISLGIPEGQAGWWTFDERSYLKFEKVEGNFTGKTYPAASTDTAHYFCGWERVV